MAFCAQCGSPIDISHRFCGDCGSEQDAPLEPVPESAPGPPRDQVPEPVQEPAPALPMYRPEALRPTADGDGESALRATGRALWAVADGVATTMGVVARILLIVLWAGVAVILVQAGQVPVALACGAYALYLICGGRWFIW